METELNMNPAIDDQLLRLELQRFDQILLLAANESNLELSPHGFSEQGDLASVTANLDSLEREIAANESDSPLGRIANAFTLDSVERTILVAMTAFSIDERYAKIFAELQNELTRPYATIDLLDKLVRGIGPTNEPVNRRFTADSPLIRYDLIQIADDPMHPMTPMRFRPLMMSERIVQFLLGDTRIAGNLHPVVRVVNPSEANSIENLDIIEDAKHRTHNICSYLSTQNQLATVVVFGPTGSQKREICAAICEHLDIPLLEVDVSLFRSRDESEIHGLIAQSLREAILFNAIVCFINLDALGESEPNSISILEYLRDSIARHPGPVLLTTTDLLFAANFKGTGRPFFSLSIPYLGHANRHAVWERSLKDTEVISDRLTVSEISDSFQLTPGQIHKAIEHAKINAYIRSGQDNELLEQDILHGCRQVSNDGLSRLAARIPARFNWNDLILPDETMSQLQEACAEYRHRTTVYEEWQFASTLTSNGGLSMLFSGPPGTGKTMAASVMASELGLEACKIDLSTIMSKYVGDTEKKLEKVFAEAERSNSLLFFDEADALFGKRSEVNDAQDRYANAEVGFLLQRIEDFRGITILASNLSTNMDEAFTRRLSFTIEFPFPDHDERILIWKLAFPKAAPLDESVDLNFLAEQFKITGASIKSIAVHAAFFAAEENTPITMRHIILATRREYTKNGRSLMSSELGDYADLLEA